MPTTPPTTRRNAPPDAGAVAIIPARLASSRFPRKVLADATGKPLIQHVVERARLARRVARVVIAADGEEVARAVRGFGGECVLTDPAHPNGTSRLAQAADLLGMDDGAVVINVQGDEPEVEPGAIDAAVEALTRTGAEVSTIASPFGPGDDPANPNLVKVVVSQGGLALYFSRASVPHHRDPAQATGLAAPFLRHVGLYAYRAGYLRRYARMAPTPLERTEVLEQLRVIETGGRIAVAMFESRSQGIDTPEQYAAFVARWRGSDGAGSV